jgi:hypothetical protein
MSDLDPEVIETTDLLLKCVSDIVSSTVKGEVMPLSAMLVYKTMNSQGQPRIDYVITHDLDMLDAVGMAEFVKTMSLQYFVNQDDDE